MKVPALSAAHPGRPRVREDPVHQPRVINPAATPPHARKRSPHRRGIRIGHEHIPDRHPAAHSRRESSHAPSPPLGDYRAQSRRSAQQAEC
jgi:hypothetical protein